MVDRAGADASVRVLIVDDSSLMRKASACPPGGKARS